MKLVKITTEFITLGQLLKYLGIIASGHEAKTFLQTENVLVNGENENRRGRKIYKNDQISIKGSLYKIDGWYVLFKKTKPNKL